MSVAKPQYDYTQKSIFSGNKEFLVRTYIRKTTIDDHDKKESDNKHKAPSQIFEFDEKELNE